MANRVDFQVGFSVDKNGLNNISSIFKQIQAEAANAKLTGNLTKELEQASIAAKQLENILNGAWNSKLGQLDLSKVNNGIKQTYGSVQQLQTHLNSIGQGNAFNQLAREILHTNNQLKQSNKLLDDMATSMANTIKWGITSSIFNNITNSIQQAWNYSIKLDTSLNDIRIVTGKGADEMERFAVQANKAAKELGSSTREYTNASLIYYQQGLSDEETAARTETTIKTANVTGQTGAEVSEQLTAIWNGYKVSASEAELYIDKVAKVAATTAADLEEMATGMSKVASAANSAGVDIDQLNAMLATVISVTREAPETIGTSFRSIFARLGDLKKGGTDEEGLGLGQITKKVADFGIELLDAKGEMREMGDIITDIAAKWENLSRGERQALAIAAAGKQQYSRFIALFDNWDMYERALEDSKTAMGTLQEQQDIYMESTAAHLQKLTTEAERTYDILFDTDSVNDMTDAVTGLLSVFNDFLAGIGGGTNVLAFFGATLTNIFSKQLANGISTTIQNIQGSISNVRGVDLKDQFAQSIIQQERSQGNDIGYEAALKEAEIVEKTLKVRKGLTEEQYQEITALQRQVGLDEDRIQYLNKYEQISRDVLYIEDASIGNFKERLSIEEQELAEEQKKLDIFQKNNAFLNEGMQIYGNINQLIDEQALVWESIYNIKQNSNLTDEEAARLDEILLDSASGRALTEQEVLDIQQIQNRIIQEQKAQVDLVRQGLEGKQAAEDGTLFKLQEEQAAREKIIEQIQRQASSQMAIQGSIQILSTLVTLLTTINGLFKTANDSSLTLSEKIKQIGTTLLMTLPMIVLQIVQITEKLPSLLVSLGLVKTAEDAATMSAVEMWIAILGPVALIAAGIALVVAGIYQLVKAYNADADAAKEAAEAAKNLKKEYEELTTTVKQFKDTLSDYREAKSALKDLDSTTEEYKETLEKANKAAKELVENNTKLQAIATRDANGLIIFDQKGLEEYEKAQDRALKKAEAISAGSQLWANQLQAKSNITDATRKLDFEISSASINELSAIYQEHGALLDTDVDNLTTASDELKENIKKEIKNSNSTIIKLMESNGELKKSNSYLASVITGQYLEENNEDYRRRDDTQKTAIQNLLKQTEVAVAERNTGLYTYYKEKEEERIKNAKGTSLFTASEIEKNTIADLAKRYAELKNWTYTSSSRKGASFAESESEVSIESMIEAVATEHANKSLNAINELTNYQGAANLVDAFELFGKNLDKIFNTNGQLYEDLLYYVSGTDKEIKTLDQLSPEEVEKLKSQMLEVVGSLENYDWSKTAFESAQEFITAWNAEMDAQYDPLEYYKNEYIRQDKKATDSQQALKVLSEGDEGELEDDQVDFLKSLEKEYEELGAIQDRTSHEYLHLLRQIKEQSETNAIEALKNEKAIQEERLANKMKELKRYQEEYDDLTDEEKENLSPDDELYINIIGITDEIEETIKALEETDHTIQMKIEADLATDVEDAFDIADEIGQLQASIKEGLEYTFDEAQELIAKGYGAMLQGAKETADQTIILNEAVVNDFIDGKQAEIEADRNAKIRQLEEQKTLLKAQREALVNKLEALQQAAKAETDVDAATAMEKVAIADNVYKAKVEELNQKLKDEAKSATAEENINEELYNWLGDVYETDSKNEQQAESDATNQQAVEIERRINNVRALHTAYSSLATQIRESEKGVNIPFESGNVQGGGGTSTTKSTSVSANNVQANEITVEDLKSKTKDLFNEDRKEYKATVDALISATQSQIQGIDNQIGSIDAGIAALRSAGKSLDDWQSKAKNAKKDKSGGKDDPDHMDELKDEADRYHVIDEEIKQIDTDLSRLQKQQDKLFGKDLLNNIAKQLKTIDKQIDNYNKKIAIATQEAAELRMKLSGYGAQFDSDGNLLNYVEMYNSQLAYVNSLIAQYNNMSKEAQAGFKDTVEAAKKSFDQFVKDMDRYDELVVETIPGIQDQIQDKLDEKIELQIERFNMEIEIRLNMAEAERDWNEFKRKVIDSIKDDDILGNARARLADFSSYYKSNGTGIVQANTQHVNDVLAQLKQMDATGTSEVYGDNRTRALEDLKTYYEQLMQDLENVVDLQEEVHQAYLDMMDEAQSKFDDQIKMYEQVSDIIEHDMRVIELVKGETAYGELSKYYQMQEDNYAKQMDFQRQQVLFWEAQMAAAEEGSKEWEDAKEKWMDAVNEWNDLVESRIENLQDKYLNAINLIFQELNNKVTSGLGLEYVGEEWELINKNADQYLDTINAMYGIRDLQKKYQDAIDNTSSISAQRRLNALMEEEVKKLQEKDKLTEYDVQRAEMRYQIALKQIALEEAQQNKSSMRLRRDSQGNYTYQFTADDNQVGQLEDELSALKNDLYNFDLERYRDNLDQLYSIWEEYQEKMAEAAQINDPEERAEREALIQEQYGELINGLVEQNTTIRSNLYESAFEDLADLYDVDLSEFQNLSDEEKEILMSDMIPQWDSGVQHMADVFAGEGGFYPTCADAMDKLADATKEYQEAIDELTREATENEDRILQKTQELIYSNDELINKYYAEMDAVRALMVELDGLIAKYEAARQSAIAATQAAYAYWQQENAKAAAAAGADKTGGASGTSGSTSGSGSSSGSSGSGSGESGSGKSGSGDGIASVGDVATFSGKYYYDSFGTSPAGNRYSGVQNGVVIDIVNNNPYGIHIHSADGKFPDLGWVKKSQLTGYDTGGYTGDWGDDTGRLALLHKKELILNATDTSNILRAVEVMRDIEAHVASRNQNLLSAVGAPGNVTAASTSDTLEQNVHIEANFPNVQNSNEIEQAFNNLVNIASQRAYRRNK